MLNQRELIKIFAFSILAAFIFAIYFGAFSATLGVKHYAFLYPVISERFSDLFSIVDTDPSLVFAKGQVLYPPLSYFIFHPLKYLKHSWLVVLYFLTSTGFLCWYASYYLKEYRQQVSKIEFFTTLFIIAFLNYPILFVLDRGNIEIWIFILVAMFVILFQKQRYKSSAVLLAIACAMKVYPEFF